MKSAFFKSLTVLLGTLFLSSCVVMQESPEAEARSEKRCFYDRFGTYRCTTCYGSECTCQVSVMELCSFRTWEETCHACEDYRFFNDLRISNASLDGCSQQALCNLCQAGFSVCDYPRSEWRFEFRPGPPPPPHRPPPRHHRGRPDDFPKR